MRSLVSFSGGLDSLYVLWKELTETSNEVTAVYFVSKNIPYKLYEQYKIRTMTPLWTSVKIADRLKNVQSALIEKTRPFEMAIVRYDLSKLVDPATGSNHASVLRTRWAVDRINAGMYDRFVSGHTRDNDGFGNRAEQIQTNHTASSLSAYAFRELALRGEYALPLLETNYTLANALSEMPPDIVALNLSCEISDPPCGKCYKCGMQKLAKSKLDSGMTPDQFFDYTMSKSMISAETWRSQKRWLAEEVPEYETGVQKDWPMPAWGKSYKVSE